MTFRPLSLFLAVSLALIGPIARDVAAETTAPAPATADEIRSLELTDQDGHPFKLGDALGRTLVLNFIFTGCGDICPTQTADLAEIERQLPPDLRAHVMFVSVSIDPEHDIPGVLRQYGEQRQVDFDIARFVTGPADAIARIVAFYGTPRPPGAPPLAPTQHDGVVHIVDAKGQARMGYRGAPLDTARLAQDIAAFTTLDLSAR